MNSLLQTLETPPRRTSKPWNYSACRTPVLGISRPGNFHPLEISSLRLPLIGGLHIAATLSRLASDFFRSAFPISASPLVPAPRNVRPSRNRT